MSQPYLLYGAEISYFSGKVRAYLRWKAISFREIAASAEIYRDVIVPRVGFPVIPVVLTPAGETLQDSSDIIDALEAQFGPPPVLPAGVQGFVAALFELYGDEWLVIPAMHYRWHHNREWAIRQFGALNMPLASPDEQYAIGSKRAGPFAQAAIALGASPHMHAAIESSYVGLLGELNRHFEELPFLLGTRPSLGDFGLYGPLYAHQFRDPASGELMRRLAPSVASWVERMRDAPAPLGGEFLAGDEIPTSLIPVLRRMMREQWPVLVDSTRLLGDWLTAHPGEAIPRVIGRHAFDLEGVRGERIIRPYSLWMLQRVLDAYRRLDRDERVRAHHLLGTADETAGGTDIARPFERLPRLKRVGMSVALA